MYEFKNKVVLITGGANGIGAAISAEVLAEGAEHVRILDIDAKSGVNLQNTLNEKYGNNKTKFVECDVTQDEQLFKAFDDVKQEHGYLDVVFNNAAVGEEETFAAIRKQIEVNYIAVVNGTLKALELMDSAKGGRGGAIMNTASAVGLVPLLTSQFTYTSTKSAIIQFNDCVGIEPAYMNNGIRIISLCFGLTDTDIVSSFTSFKLKADESTRHLFSQYYKQSIQSAARGAIEAYKKGNTASTWLIQKDEPAVDISEIRKKHHDEILNILQK